MAGDLRVSEQHGYAVLQYNYSLQIRVPVTFVQSAGQGYSKVRVNVSFAQAVAEGYPNVRSNASITQAAAEGYPNVRSNYVVFQCCIPAPNEEVMVTTTLPGFGNSTLNPSIPASLDVGGGGLPGLAFSVHKKPTFNTRVSESVAFRTVRSMLADHPRWDFELTYEFLEDSSGAQSSLKQLQGAFLAAGGRALPFLYKDPDDYIATGSVLGTADGTTLQFDFLRWIGSVFNEPVGQVDTANAIAVHLQPMEAATVPSSGPYTVTVAHAAAFEADVGVTAAGNPLTKVSGAPGAGQYSVSAGVYTFSSAQAGNAAVITYRYLADPGTYSITLPNKLVFGSAPAASTIITADFQYFFTCYFNDDVVDFEKFANQLWSLQTLAFHSELLA